MILKSSLEWIETMKKIKPSDLELTYESNYLSDEFYDALLSDRDAAKNFGPCTDASLVSECLLLLNCEARLLDDQRYDEWLGLYSKQAIYWVPYDDNADIRSHINLMFDDRRRLEDRVLRLISVHAHTLAPTRKLQHNISNVEAWEMSDGRRRVLAHQVAYEYRHGHQITRHVYRTDHTFVFEEAAWKIAVKRCVLLNLDAAVEPPTLL